MRWYDDKDILKVPRENTLIELNVNVYKEISSNKFWCYTIVHFYHGQQFL